MVLRRTGALTLHRATLIPFDQRYQAKLLSDVPATDNSAPILITVTSASHGAKVAAVSSPRLWSFSRQVNYQSLPATVPRRTATMHFRACYRLKRSATVA